MLLDRSHDVTGTGRVRLRLARPRDREAVQGLLGELGVAAEDLDVLRLLRCAPGRCLTIVALAWDGAREQLVGVGHLAVRSGDVTLLPGRDAVGDLLLEALDTHAQTWTRRVA